MKTIDLNAKSWITIVDFCNDLFEAIGAPDGHGYSIDAILDSLIWQSFNSVKPPLIIKVHWVDNKRSEILDQLVLLQEYIAEARLEHFQRLGNDVNVTIEIVLQ